MGGAEIDLILEMGSRHGTWAIEIKRPSAPKVERGLRSALDDIAPKQAFLVHGGTDRFPLGGSVEAIGLEEMAKLLASLM